MAARRLEEERVNEEVPPQVEKVPQGGKGVQGSQDAQVSPQGDPIPIVEGGIEVPDMSNREIREALIAIARAVTMQDNLNMMPRAVESTITSRLRDFVRMNPSIFLVSKVNEDPREFLDGVYKVLSAMGVTSREKAELILYKLRDVFPIWYTRWKDYRPEGLGPIEWEEFKEVFRASWLVSFGYGDSLWMWKRWHKVRDCPSISSKKKGKQVAPSVPKYDASTKRCFYALRSMVVKPDEKESDDDVEVVAKVLGVLEVKRQETTKTFDD
ncbi:hypothetical protein EJD97_009502 [Solanum chilense]|uniref:Gag-pol polyprotein n=1 Tax=Solanum chilense TaxID=4083 RepID=A0A6N2C9M2_SOLCI|nr:hypothetical protein EJD97_009502 [Solanum chilense]